MQDHPLLPWYEERIIKLPEVRKITGLSRSRLYARVKEGRFPRPMPIGEGSRARGWLLSQVHEWVRQQFSGIKPPTLQ